MTTPAAEQRTAQQKHKLSEMVKAVTDAYMQQLGLEAKIDKKVREAWVQEQQTQMQKEMDVEEASPAAVPADATSFERRLRKLEKLFLETTGVDTGDPTVQPAFAAPPALPGTGNFAVPLPVVR